MFDILTQAIELLTRPPGDLVFHLIVLFALEAMLGFAMLRARRTGWSLPLRQFAITGTVVLIGRLALIVVALLSLQGIPPDVVLATAVTPPLERAIDLVSLGFLAWAFVPLLRQRAQLGVGLLIVNSMAAAIAYAVMAGEWWAQASNGLYPATSQETIWQVWSLAIASVAALASSIGPRPRHLHRAADAVQVSGAALAAFVFLALGHALQFARPLAGTHIAAWVRLAQLAAYPMLVVVVYQLTVIDEARSAATPVAAESTIAPAFDLSDPLWQATAAIQSLTPKADVPLTLQQIAARLAAVFQADIVAIGLRAPDSPMIELSAIHHPGAAPSLGARLAVNQQPSLQRAVDRGHAVIVSKSEAALELAEVFGLMGSFVTGPLLVAPLIDDTQSLGLVLLGNSTSGREWTTVDVERADAVCDRLASALAVTHYSRHLAARAEDLEHAVRKIETEATQRRLALETALRTAQTEAQSASIRLASLAKLQEELAAQRGTEDARWQQQLQTMAEERARLESALNDQQAEVASLTVLQNKLEAQMIEARQQLAAQADQLAGADQSIERSQPVEGELEHQREVLASIVQELRTPMTSITGYTDLLLGESVGILGAMQRQFLQRVKANIERMDGMLGDLIGLTAIDTGQLKIEPEPVDVAKAIEETVMAAAGLMRERELSVRIELAEPLPRLQADRDSLHQIIKHLLSNAALCSPNNSEIVVRAQVPVEMPDFLLFSVTDRGGGIAPEDRQRAFNRMYRADHPLVQGLGETGVGLSISRTLVEAQGGRIWVDSEMGVGSTFTFVMPLNANHNGMTA
ncbi:MAG: GAF domain-containing protein [Chloroflexi bacterium]|nr:GAF domain-containing protein [Chloroflexota bacterium]